MAAVGEEYLGVSDSRNSKGPELGVSLTQSSAWLWQECEESSRR